jgi:hypothetical protein
MCVVPFSYHAPKQFSSISIIIMWRAPLKYAFRFVSLRLEYWVLRRKRGRRVIRQTKKQREKPWHRKPSMQSKVLKYRLTFSNRCTAANSRVQMNILSAFATTAPTHASTSSEKVFAMFLKVKGEHRTMEGFSTYFLSITHVIWFCENDVLPPMRFVI